MKKEIARMKRILCLMLAAMLVFSLCACGEQEERRSDRRRNRDKAEATEATSTQDEVADTEEVVEEEAAAETVDNPLSADVLYPGEKGQGDRETVELISHFLDASGVAESDILMVNVNDYDRDGTYEAFVFAGSIPEDDVVPYEGWMWFVSNETVDKMAASSTDGWTQIDGVLDFGDRVYAYATEYYATGGPSIIWSVQDGNYYVDDMSGLGSVAQINDTDFTIMSSLYDNSYDAQMNAWLGHTWKMYYFGYNPGTDSLYEYGADPVAYDQIDSLSGTDLKEQIERAGGEIITALYRMNGILHVNYRISDGYDGYTYCNANYDCGNGSFINAWEDGSGTLEDSDFGGIYLPAFCPEYAVMPAASRNREAISVDIQSVGDIAVITPAQVLLIGTDDEGVVRTYYVDQDSVLVDGDTDSALDLILSLSLDGELDKLVRNCFMTVTLGHVDEIKLR